MWDRTASHQKEYKEYSVLRRDDGGTEGTSPRSEAIFAFGAYGARGAIATDLQ